MERKYNKQPKLHIRKGDIVKVIAGDSKGSQGRVLEVLSATRKVLVEGVNLVSKHTKPNAKNTQAASLKRSSDSFVQCDVGRWQRQRYTCWP